jgi:glycosyltransferase involved in cell wall biosynthesis
MFRFFSEILIKYGGIVSFFRQFVDMHRQEGLIGLMHYIRLIFTLPAMDVLTHHRFKAGRKTILIVSHEAFQSSSSMFAVSIAKVLAGRYNIVILLSGGGPLSESFCQLEVTVLHSLMISQDPDQADIVAGQLCNRFDFKFALVNSIASRQILPFLCRHSVPTISLIHEFAADAHQRNVFREVIFWSGEVVFSARVTLQSVLADFTTPIDSNILIQIKDKEPSPLKKCTDGKLQMARAIMEKAIMEKAIVRRLIRPDDIPDDSVVVLGAGRLPQLRENIDFFIKCAARVVRFHGGDRCRFVWIDQDYNNEIDLAYHSYLTNHIRQAGLEKHVLIFVGTKALTIEVAFEVADL